ncbi:hypothetical protein QBC44DRAFT_243767 [Cladorrhinum sp. PSN332]|nr:hypothetical protein QBC44DRAFT_243767 [Cladorrhinum sp. PSN332]
MQRESRLGRLPREMRDQIYREYLFIDAEDGYVFDFETCKLRAASGDQRKPVDLNLMYTCQLMAAEMRGLPFKQHTVTFSTIYSDDLRLRALRWEHTVDAFRTRQHQMLHDVLLKPTGGMSYEVARMLQLSKFGGAPALNKAIDELIDRGQSWYSGGLWSLHSPLLGEAPSVYWAAVREMMKFLMTYPSIRQRFEMWRNRYLLDDNRTIRINPMQSLDLYHEPWQIPSEAELDSFASAFLGRVDQTGEVAPRIQWGAGSSLHNPDEYMIERIRGKYRFSAAAAAVYFLKSATGSRCRQHLRKIVLDEDRPSVAHAASHVKGLVPFCQENPALRIERRVNLWKNALQACELEVWPRSGFEPKPYELDNITSSISLWMVEAESVDLPHGVFTLLLDGDPTPTRSTDVFREVVQRDAAWQIAFDRTFPPERCLENNNRSESKFSSWAYHGSRFPELLRDLNDANELSRIRCNFHPGEPWDESQVVEISELNQGFANNDVCHWQERWARPLQVFATAHPLPTFLELLQENVIDDRIPCYIRINTGGSNRNHDEEDFPLISGLCFIGFLWALCVSWDAHFGSDVALRGFNWAVPLYCCFGIVRSLNEFRS